MARTQIILSEKEKKIKECYVACDTKHNAKYYL